jgi:hypothetical protein
MREAAKLDIAEGGGTREPTFGRNRTVYVDQSNLRPEARLEDPAHAGAGRLELVTAEVSGGGDGAAPTRPDGRESSREEPAKSSRPAVPGPARPRRPSTWTEPEVADRPASYAIYRPETGSTTQETTQPRVRTEAK